jgi:hypothetical protein
MIATLAAIAAAALVAVPALADEPARKADATAVIAADLAPRLQAVLGRAGGNAPEIARAFTLIPAKYHDAALYLVEGMPPVDLGAVKAELIASDVTWAFKARDEFPFAAKVPMPIFLAYVLPHRVTQEPLEDFRPFLWPHLAPLLAGVTSVNEAAVIVNKWCGDHIYYKVTSYRDQGPMETLKSGYGRCEEMMILFVDACRTVGIPARETYTPFWSTCNDNHAWTEVFGDGMRWYYTGSAEPRPTLDDAWFNAGAKRAAIILSVPYGVPDTGEDFYRREANFAVVNSTPRYLDACDLRIRVTGADGITEAGIPVAVSVFNYGALRPVAKLKTDAGGYASVRVGAGDLWISAGWPTEHATRIVHTVFGKQVLVGLRLKKDDAVPGAFWLKYPPPPGK